MTQLLEKYHKVEEYYRNLAFQNVDIAGNIIDKKLDKKLDVDFNDKLDALLERMSLAELEELTKDMWGGDKRMFMPYIKAARERETQKPTQAVSRPASSYTPPPPKMSAKQG